MNFTNFKEAVQRQWAAMLKIGPILRTGITKDLLWDTYLGSFPEGTNPIYRERTEHDCNCCKQFVRNIGDAVVINDGKLVSIWDVTVNDDAYQVVAHKLSQAVKSFPIENIFLHVIKTRMEENTANRLAADRAAEKQKIMRLIAEKREDALSQFSIEELEERLKKL